MTFYFTSESPNGERTLRTIEEITEDEAESKHFLGTAAGANLGHCVYMGSKYHKGFEEEVRYYHIKRDLDEHGRAIQKAQPNTIQVSFYSEK